MDMRTMIVVQADTDPMLAAFFLQRLSDLTDRLDAATDQRERIALARALFAVFLDCRDLGLDAPARTILACRSTCSTLTGHGSAA